MAFVRDLDNLIPIMTSNTAPSGYVASASSVYDGTTAAYKLFDGIDEANGTGEWLSAAGTSAWVRIQIPSAKIVNSYGMCFNLTGGYENRMPRDWTFKGSNNGTDWTTLDSRSGISWAVGVKQKFTFSNTTAYAYYELNITNNNGAVYVGIGELELCATPAASPRKIILPTHYMSTALSGGSYA